MTAQKSDTPDYLGHRARLREIFLVDDGLSMPEYELLELLLMYAIPRRDVKPLAKKLIKTFGDIGLVLNASKQDLIEKGELTPNVVALLKAVSACGMRATSSYFANGRRPIYDVWQTFIDFCRQKLGYKETEEFWVFFFNGRMEYLGGEQLGSGTLNKTFAPTQLIAKRALSYNAPFVVLAHNHPSGSCRPSDADILTTENIIESLDTVDVSVYDHIIVSPYEDFSFRATGIIEDKKIAVEKARRRKEKELKLMKTKKLLLENDEFI